MPVFIAEKPGTVLLFRKEHTEGAYTFLTRVIDNFLRRRLPTTSLTHMIARLVTRFILDMLASAVGHEYIHAELVLPSGLVVAAWFNGVVRYRPNASQILALRRITDTFIPKFEIDSVKLMAISNKYLGKEYDFASLALNFFIQVSSLNREVTEAELEERIRQWYDTSDKLICSELIARIYEELGYKIERHSEFVTPDDIAKSNLFLKV